MSEFPEAAEVLADADLLSFLHRPEINDERCSLSFPK